MDADSTIVYVTEALQRHPAVFKTLVRELWASEIEVHFVSGTRNIWIRDWAPVQTPKGFVKFRYKDELLPEYPQLRVEEHCWTDFAPDAFRSDIYLDGGNVVRNGSKVLMTDIVFQHNPSRHDSKLVEELESLLEAQIIFIPVEPDDTLGHSDGVVKWIDADTVFVNDYHTTHVPKLQDYGKRLHKVLSSHNLEVEPFPFAYQSNLCSEVEFRKLYPNADSFLPAVGYYINSLTVKGLTLFPMFNIEKDNSARNKLEKTYRDQLCLGIECRDLAMEGGLIRCATVAYRR